MVAGGCEAAVCEIGIAGFIACRAMATSFNDTPEKASRPYDKGRDGFVMGEGAGVVVLEEYEHAKARGAKIYAEVIGYGLSGDAYHITAPAEDGDGGYRAMQAALKDAGVGPSEVNYINAHGTSTMADGIELGAVERVLGQAAKGVAMSSTKSMTGHLLGAAGAIEGIFCILAIRDQVAPPTIKLDDPEFEAAARPGGQQGQADGDQRGGVQQLRLRRHQRLRRLPQGVVSRMTGAGGLSLGRRLLVSAVSAGATLIAALMLFALWALWVYQGPGPVTKDHTPITVELRHGAGLPEIAASLERAGAVKSSGHLHDRRPGHRRGAGPEGGGIRIPLRRIDGPDPRPDPQGQGGPPPGHHPGGHHLGNGR